MDAAKEQKQSFLDAVLHRISSLPAKVRNELMKIEDLDLQVKNGMIKQNEKTVGFFKIVEQLSKEEREKLVESIKEAYEMIIRDADAKIELVDGLQMGLKAHLGQLNQNIAKFKEDLERTDPGITDIIERKVAAETLPTQNDAPPPQMSKEEGS